LVHLDQQRLGDLGRNPDRVVVGGGELGGGVGQDERAGAFWLGRGEEDRGWAGVDLGQERGPFGADLVQDRGQVLGIGFPWRQGIGRERVGEARAPPVKENQPAK
jgi:hypothetical protein